MTSHINFDIDVRSNSMRARRGRYGICCRRNYDRIVMTVELVRRLCEQFGPRGVDCVSAAIAAAKNVLERAVAEHLNALRESTVELQNMCCVFVRPDGDPIRARGRRAHRNEDSSDPASENMSA